MVRRSMFPPQLTLVGSAVALLGLATAACSGQGAVPAAATVAPQNTPTLSGNLPLTVNIPSGVTTPEQARPYFDAFSWQSFVALNWPAAQKGPRGTPDRPDDPAVFTAATGGGQPVVWGTYKEDFELFSQGYRASKADFSWTLMRGAH
jgi:hypothetical protein